MKKEPLTTGQIAEYCHVTYRAVLKWIAEGKLQAYRTPGNHSRVKIEDFLAFLKKYNMPTPAELEKGRGKKRILIVDDDRQIVDLIRKGLETDSRLEMAAAYDGFMAGERFCQFRPQLVVLDINMPGLDGYQVCAQIRKNPANKDVKIIVVSGMPEIEQDEKILEVGANSRMAKPFDLQVLIKKIEKLLDMKPQEEIKEESHE